MPKMEHGFVETRSFEKGMFAQEPKELGFREMAGPRAGSCQRLIVFGYGIPGMVGIRRRGDRDVDEVGGVLLACLVRA
ncbi:hypothetical protein PTI98_008326 [Pleurotus ostreatus]|nr:hypothetical protein PTI98_008326 [Pleurotus ostreatus]